MKVFKGISQTETVIAFVILFFVGFIVVSLLFPSVSGPGPDSSRQAQAKDDTSQIATAVWRYEAEYGRWPSTPNGLVDGELLSALMGSNGTLNPRDIQFIEVRPAERNKGGFRDGSYLDPWGGDYRIAIAAGETKPFVVAGTNQIELRKMVAVWTDPNTHSDAASLTDAKKNRRYVNSWE